MAEPPPDLPDPAFERLARAVEVGTLRALTRFALYLLVFWLLLSFILPLALTAGGTVLSPLLVIAALVLVGLIAYQAFRSARSRP